MQLWHILVAFGMCWIGFKIGTAKKQGDYEARIAVLNMALKDAVQRNSTLTSDLLQAALKMEQFHRDLRSAFHATQAWNNHQERARQAYEADAKRWQHQQRTAPPPPSRSKWRPEPPPPPMPQWARVLQITTRTPTRDQIQSAFRKQAKAGHPDHGGTEAAMASVIQAREEAMADLERREAKQSRPSVVRRYFYRRGRDSRSVKGTPSAAAKRSSVESCGSTRPASSA